LLYPQNHPFEPKRPFGDNDFRNPSFGPIGRISPCRPTPSPSRGLVKQWGKTQPPGKRLKGSCQQGGVLSARARGEREHGRERLTAKRDELRTQGRNHEGRTSSKGSIQERAAAERCWQCEAGPCSGLEASSKLAAAVLPAVPCHRWRGAAGCAKASVGAQLVMPWNRALEEAPARRRGGVRGGRAPPGPAAAARPPPGRHPPARPPPGRRPPARTALGRGWGPPTDRRRHDVWMLRCLDVQMFRC